MKTTPATISQTTLSQAGRSLPEHAAGDQAQDHRRQRGDEAERRVAAAVVRERPLAGEQVEEPGVERPGQVAVLVPVGGEAGHAGAASRPGTPDRGVIEVRTRQG